MLLHNERSFPGSAVVKNLHASAGDTGDSGLIPGLGRSPGVGNGNLLQYSCLEYPMDPGAFWATVHGVTESDMTEHTNYIIMGQIGLLSYGELPKHCLEVG